MLTLQAHLHHRWHIGTLLSLSLRESLLHKHTWPFLLMVVPVASTDALIPTATSPVPRLMPHKLQSLSSADASKMLMPNSPPHMLQLSAVKEACVNGGLLVL